MIAIAAVIPAYVSAQGFSIEPTYMGEIHAGYVPTKNSNGTKGYSQTVTVGTLQGVSLNEYLDLGIGVDVNMFTHYYSGKGLRFWGAGYFDMRPSFPLSDNFKLYLDLGLGYYFKIKSEPWGKNAFYCQFGPGFRYRKFNLMVGLVQYGTGQGGMDNVTAKIGLYF